MVLCFSPFPGSVLGIWHKQITTLPDELWPAVCYLLHLGFYSFPKKTMLCYIGKKKIPATLELPLNCIIVTKSQCLLSDLCCVGLRWDRQEGGSGVLCHLQMPVYVELVKAQGVIAARFKIVDTDIGHSNSTTVRVELRGAGGSRSQDCGQWRAWRPSEPWRSMDWSKHRHPRLRVGNGSFPAYTSLMSQK